MPATPRVACCRHFVAMLPVIAVVIVVVVVVAVIICCAFVFAAIKIGCNLVGTAARPKHVCVRVCVCVDSVVMLEIDTHCCCYVLQTSVYGLPINSH